MAQTAKTFSNSGMREVARKPSCIAWGRMGVLAAGIMVIAALNLSCVKVPPNEHDYHQNQSAKADSTKK